MLLGFVDLNVIRVRTFVLLGFVILSVTRYALYFRAGGLCTEILVDSDEIINL